MNNIFQFYLFIYSSVSSMVTQPGCRLHALERPLTQWHMPPKLLHFLDLLSRRCPLLSCHWYCQDVELRKSSPPPCHDHLVPGRSLVLLSWLSSADWCIQAVELSKSSPPPYYNHLVPGRSLVLLAWLSWADWCLQAVELRKSSPPHCHDHLVPV